MTKYFVLAAVLIGCGSSFYAQDIQSAQDAARDNARAYELMDVSDAGTPARAFNRAAYCAAAAILTRHQVSTPDAGIECNAQ